MNGKAKAASAVIKNKVRVLYLLLYGYIVWRVKVS